MCQCLGRWHAAASVGVERAGLTLGYALGELNLIPCLCGASEFVCSIKCSRIRNSLHKLMGFRKPAVYISLQIFEARMRR